MELSYLIKIIEDLFVKQIKYFKHRKDVENFVYNSFNFIIQTLHEHSAL